jgi:ubiquinone/menaquinone biosynthesis C-methylase UbiE
MKSLLYDIPSLYEKIFEKSADDLCLKIFEKHLGKMPNSILDIGCGTGRDLFKLSHVCRDRVGIDYLPTMIQYARERYPGITFQVGDMRSVRLGRKFESILALGNSINYALTNEDIEKTLETYQIHSNPGALLIIEPWNSYNFLGTFECPTNLEVKDDEITASATIQYRLLKGDQILEMEQFWTLVAENKQPKEMTYENKFRLIFPQELKYFLNKAGFEVLDFFESQRSKSWGATMYVICVFRG